MEKCKKRPVTSVILFVSLSFDQQKHLEHQEDECEGHAIGLKAQTEKQNAHGTENQRGHAALNMGAHYSQNAKSGHGHDESHIEKPHVAVNVGQLQQGHCPHHAIITLGKKRQEQIQQAAAIHDTKQSVLPSSVAGEPS